MARSVRILRASDVGIALDMSSCIEACEQAFAAYATGGAELPSVIHLDVPSSAGTVHVKAGHLHGAPYYAVKVASGFDATDPPAVDGLVMVFDANDGAPVAFLLDGGLVTDVRTGAAGGVAARHLAPQRVRVAAAVGSGAQAVQQVVALAQVRPSLQHVRVWGRHPVRAASAAAAIQQQLGPGVVVVPAADVAEAVAGAQVVITCTAAREPLLFADMLGPGTHVTAVGSDGAGKQELDPRIMREADLVVVDSRDQCSALGELQHALDRAADAVELGSICAGLEPGRRDEAALTVCDLTGLGVQDVAAANVVMANIGDRGDVISL